MWWWCYDVIMNIFVRNYKNILAFSNGYKSCEIKKMDKIEILRKFIKLGY